MSNRFVDEYWEELYTKSDAQVEFERQQARLQKLKDDYFHTRRETEALLPNISSEYEEYIKDHPPHSYETLKSYMETRPYRRIV